MSESRTISRFMIFVVFMAFVSIGLPDAVFGVAWPSIRETFGIHNAMIGVINIPGSIVYMITSASAGTLLARLGLGRILWLATLLAGIGLFTYGIAPWFWMLPVATMLIAAGAGAIDSVLNVYAAERFSLRVMNWLHAFYGIGALAGPFIMAGVFSRGLAWRVGYAVIAALLFGMMLLFVRTRLLWEPPTTSAGEDHPDGAMSTRRILRMPLVWACMALFFANAAVESPAGLWASSLLMSHFGLSRADAAVWTGIYWVALTGGRIVIPVVAHRLRPARLYQLATFTVLAAAALMTRDNLTLFRVGLILLGIGISTSFPTAMTLTPLRLGSRVAAYAVGMEVTASTFGFAILPSIGGAIADHWGIMSVTWIIFAGACGLVAMDTLLRARTTETQPSSSTSK